VYIYGSYPKIKTRVPLFLDHLGRFGLTTYIYIPGDVKMRYVKLKLVD